MRQRRTGSFETIRIRGAMLPSDIVQRVRDLDPSLDGTGSETYHVAEGERLEERINRAWKAAREAWQAFAPDLARILDTRERGTSETRERWLLPLFEELGYGRLLTRTAGEIDGKKYPVSHGWHHVPIHLLGASVDLDQTRVGVAGAARSNPHAMVQEYLNRSREHLWAFVSNGRRLRILRDNASLVRQAFVEFDLEAMMDGGLYADFRVLWLLLHQSRVEQDEPEECWLEVWSRSAASEGARALDALRDGVEQAVATLGSALIVRNRTLQDAAREGTVTPQGLFRQLLRLAYRFIFVFAAEDRGLLLDPRADPEARRRYADFYSTRRLRNTAAEIRGGRHPDLMRLVWRVFDALGSAKGEPRLGLPALGSFLWSKDALPDIEGLDIPNRALLEALRQLAFVEIDGKLRPVDYRNMGPEELGSVYESLLELVPRIEGEAFRLESLSGSERKTTGSYYTRDDLVDQLMQSALDPLLDRAVRARDPESALLALKVCDPACGSGHFLIAAAHRIAGRLASVRSGDEQPGEADLTHALRDVIARCLYGVDLNEMAVELCKINLWLEALEPGRPLSYLDHHIRHGNSLLGATPALIAGGITDDAFKPVTLDDREVAKLLKKRNRGVRRIQHDLFIAGVGTDDLAAQVTAIEALPEDTVAQVEEKRRRHEEALVSEEFRNRRLQADAWCAAFFLKKDGKEPYLTQKEFLAIRSQPDRTSAELLRAVQRVADQYHLFHWHLAFPEVFGPVVPGGGRSSHGWDGGFDLVAGNPPWEHIELKEKEWFAPVRPDVAAAPTKAARERLIRALETEDPPLYHEFCESKRGYDAQRAFLGSSGLYPLCGRGRINFYQVFAELFRHLIGPRGRVAIVLPSGIATDDTTKFFFQDLMESGTLVSLYDFENRKALFPGVHRSYKFALVTLSGRADPAPAGTDFVFFAHDIADLRDEDRHFTLTAEEIALLNPNTRTCPIFRSKRDAELTKAIYRRVPVLVKEARDGEAEENPWRVTFKQGLFNMSTDSHLFRTREQLEAEGFVLEGNHFVRGGERWLPLYEAKMIHQFNHRFATFSGSDTSYVGEESLANPEFRILPRYWVEDSQVDHVAPAESGAWFVVFRKTARSTDERTMIASAIPLAAVSDRLPLAVTSGIDDETRIALLALLNSFLFDFTLRQKLGGTDVSHFYVKQLPILPPVYLDRACPWDLTMEFREWLVPRTIELTASSTEISSALGWSESLFRWNPTRRADLRAEIDASFFAVLGLPREDVAYIMDTFPIVRRRDEASFGTYRTKELILSNYDMMMDAMASE